MSTYEEAWQRIKSQFMIVNRAGGIKKIQFQFFLITFIVQCNIVEKVKINKKKIKTQQPPIHPTIEPNWPRGNLRPRGCHPSNKIAATTTKMKTFLWSFQRFSKNIWQWLWKILWSLMGKRSFVFLGRCGKKAFKNININNNNKYFQRFRDITTILVEKA